MPPPRLRLELGVEVEGVAVEDVLALGLFAQHAHLPQRQRLERPPQLGVLWKAGGRMGGLAMAASREAWSPAHSPMPALSLSSRKPSESAPLKRRSTAAWYRETSSSLRPWREAGERACQSCVPTNARSALPYARMGTVP